MSSIEPEKAAELEASGVDSVRQLLSAFSSDPTAGTDRERSMNIGKATVKRREVEEWLREKKAAAEHQGAKRHAEQLAASTAAVERAKWATWVGAASLIATVLFGLLSLLK